MDTKGALPQPQYDKGMRGRGGRGRFGGRGRGRFAPAPMGEEAKFNAKFGKKVVTAPVSKWKKNQQANYGGNRWNDQKPVRTREASVDVRPDWTVNGQVTFQEMQKLAMEAPESADVYTCGTLHTYDKQYDRVNPKAEKALVSPGETAFYKVSTSDDPIIARLHDDPKLKGVRVFATDAILAVIMAAPRYGAPPAARADGLWAARCPRSLGLPSFGPSSCAWPPRHAAVPPCGSPLTQRARAPPLAPHPPFYSAARASLGIWW